MNDLSQAAGAQLDLLANDRFNIRRYPNESDQAFRKRVRAMMADGTLVKLGPLTIFDRTELEVVRTMFRSRNGPIRDTIIAIIDAQSVRGGGPTWPAGSKEQVIFEVAKAFTDEGIVVEGKVLESGQRTPAWVDLAALDVWYAASVLILDDGEG